MNNNKKSLSTFERFYIYQKERFPILGHGLLVASFSFSAIAYARICRGVEGFVDWKIYIVGIFTTITLFLLVRIFDEHKDAEEDARYRKELPVPRGLVTLNELRNIGIVVIILQILVNLYFFPKMLWLYFLVIGYLLLMGKEFFIAEWLKKHQFWYVTSHMFIIPLVDIYASGLDWLLVGASAPSGLLFFFAVSYMNGIVLEIGRKIRAPEQESAGVLTYSAMLGAKKATYLWLGIVGITWFLSIAAATYAGFGKVTFFILLFFFLLCIVIAFNFLAKKTVKNAKAIELVSALWTIAMYLTLGGIPMLLNFI